MTQKKQVLCDLQVLFSDIQLSNSRITMLIVTHEMGFAREVSDRVLFFDQGAILEDGSPEEVFEKPQHKRTKEFLAKVL